MIKLFNFLMSGVFLFALILLHSIQICVCNPNVLLDTFSLAGADKDR